MARFDASWHKLHACINYSATLHEADKMPFRHIETLSIVFMHRLLNMRKRTFARVGRARLLQNDVKALTALTHCVFDSLYV